MAVVSQLLRQSAAEGTAVIVITHDLELIAAISDYNLDLTPNKETP
jgi:ABC-type glutathione transport system ATPase component